MSDNRRRYRAIRDAIMQLYAAEPKGNTARHLQTLAAMVSGIVGSQRTNLPAIAGRVPDGSKRESRVKKYYRWLTNKRIGTELYFLPFADALLRSLAHSPLVLAMDGSEAGRGCLILMVSVIYRKRALPLAWTVIKSRKGHFSEEAHVEPLERIHILVPQGCTVIFLGDGEFDGPEVKCVAATDVHCVDVLDPLRRQPLRNFKVRDDRATGPLGNRNGIADMVAVPVRNDEIIGIHFLGSGACRRITGEKGVDDDRFSGGFDLECTVTEEGDCRGHGVLLADYDRRAEGVSLPVMWNNDGLSYGMQRARQVAACLIYDRFKIAFMLRL